MSSGKEQLRDMLPPYYYPPYPKNAGNPNSLTSLEKTKQFYAQRKFNGTHIVILIGDQGEIELYNRHNKIIHSILHPDLKKSFQKLTIPNGKIILVGELLHNKTKSIKNCIVLFDIIYYQKYLFNMSQTDRFQILYQEMCPQTTKGEFAKKITQHLWIAEVFETNFKEEFHRHELCDEIEGLILRDKRGRLNDAGSKPYSTNSLLKFRKPHKSGIYKY